MLNGTNLHWKDNPRWPIGNPPETIKVKDTGPAGPRHGPPGTRTSQRATRRGLGRRGLGKAAGEVFGAWTGAAAGWLAGLTRRTGARLFAAADTEARWRGWQITELQGGLARRYRDPRWDTLRARLPRPGQERSGRTTETDR